MKWLIPVLALTTAVPAQAVSLRELLNAAEKANVDRKISAEQRHRAALDLRQSWSALLPSLSSQGSWTNNQYPAKIQTGPTTELVITPDNQFDFVARVEVPLVDVTRWLRPGVAESADQAAELRDEQTVDNVQRMVATTYYSFAAALALRDSAKRSLGVAEAQSNFQEIRFKAGTVTELEVLRASSEVQRSRQTLTDAESLVANARRSLRTLTGVEITDDAALPTDNLTPEGTLQEMEGKSDQLPGVKAAGKDAEAAGKLASLARYALLPTITANFTERVTNATGFAGKAASYTAGIGFGWRLDVPSVLGLDAQDSQAVIARLAVERQQLAARDQIHNDWQRLNAAIQKVTSARSQVESAQRAAQMARDRYAAGAATQIDVIQSERDLFSAEVNHIQARTELASSHVGLQISSGLPLRVD